jgi:hypothetical protein
MLIHMPFTMPRMVRNAENTGVRWFHVRYAETIKRWQTHP